MCDLYLYNLHKQCDLLCIHDHHTMPGYWGTLLEEPASLNCHQHILSLEATDEIHRVKYKGKSSTCCNDTYVHNDQCFATCRAFPVLWVGHVPDQSASPWWDDEVCKSLVPNWHTTCSFPIILAESFPSCPHTVSYCCDQLHACGPAVLWYAPKVGDTMEGGDCQSKYWAYREEER